MSAAIETLTLMGRRYERSLLQVLIQGVSAMEESVTYQFILRKGAISELKKVLFRVGTLRYGPPSDEIRHRIGLMSDLEQLEILHDRTVTAASWEELLRGTP